MSPERTLLVEWKMDESIRLRREAHEMIEYVEADVVLGHESERAFGCRNHAGEVVAFDKRDVIILQRLVDGVVRIRLPLDMAKRKGIEPWRRVT